MQKPLQISPLRRLILSQCITSQPLEKDPGHRGMERFL